MPATELTRAQALGNPQWDRAEKVHDWRNHVPAIVQQWWHTFTRDQKLVLLEWAEDLSDREEWE